MPWEHKSHLIYITTGRAAMRTSPEPDRMRVDRNGTMVDITVLEREGFELMAFYPQGEVYGTGIFKRFVKEGE